MTNVDLTNPDVLLAMLDAVIDAHVHLLAYNLMEKSSELTEEHALVMAEKAVGKLFDRTLNL